MIRASRTSYSPESRVRTSSASTAFWILASSPSASASDAASPSSWPSCDHDLEVVDAAGQLGEPVDLALEPGEPAGDPGGVGLVVPQVGGRDLLAEVRDLAAHGGDVEHLLDGAHGRAELLDLGVEVGSCHEVQRYCGRPAHRFVRRGRPRPHAGAVRSCRAPAACPRRRCRRDWARRRRSAGRRGDVEGDRRGLGQPERAGVPRCAVGAKRDHCRARRRARSRPVRPCPGTTCSPGSRLYSIGRSGSAAP